jgi:hypothetical protein
VTPGPSMPGDADIRSEYPKIDAKIKNSARDADQKGSRASAASGNFIKAARGAGGLCSKDLKRLSLLDGGFASPIHDQADVELSASQSPKYCVCSRLTNS